MSTLVEALSRKGMKIETVTEYIQFYLDEHWQMVWRDHLSEIERVYAQSGDPAYGVYGRALFPPVDEELRQANLTCRPGFPGEFSSSWEQGPREERERRFWCVLQHGEARTIGALVTRFFHDHPQLRIPRPPVVLTVEKTDPAA